MGRSRNYRARPTPVVGAIAAPPTKSVATMATTAAAPSTTMPCARHGLPSSSANSLRDYPFRPHALPPRHVRRAAVWTTTPCAHHGPLSFSPILSRDYPFQQHALPPRPGRRAAALTTMPCARPAPLLETPPVHEAASLPALLPPAVFSALVAAAQALPAAPAGLRCVLLT